MARPIERIEQDIIELEKAISAIAIQLKNAYESYLSVLGKAVCQQLILASYHLCTQGYPENFLKLSLNQRQKLQQAMRNLAKSASQDMQALIDDQELEEDEEEEEEEVVDQHEYKETIEENNQEHLEENLEIEEEDLVGIIQELDMEDEDDQDLAEIARNLEAEDDGQLTNNLSQTTSYTSIPPNVKIPSFSENFSFPMLSLEPSLSNDWKKWFSPNTSNPMELAAWQKNLEKAISYILKSLSRDGNRLLQKANILPQKLPEPILEAAAASVEASTEMIPGPPNLLSLVVGIESEEKQLDAESLTQIMALNLRLVEIEFADVKLSSERQQIRNILNQLAKLGREYQKKQRERSVATAEAAWRASWYED
ncbi:MAG: hypothetical protein HC836_21705 [Richelia sp. RM2_1_2]|nr:hypothetical protein [Richelia sp. SM2_1_7]NJM22182.1 hypothetical protein [Richelia sp. SM1_7_0]NJN08907.1 hypothetical protein [Richelia sp. RM1_1_1]NJO29630.1 hypothetical protein [Richelia sp. SL_2_1]NJO60775.1 hypothetical protein [Richelia sp. RM2_1_2]